MQRNIPMHLRRGSAAVLAMLCLVILSTLAAAMYSVSMLNLKTASNYADVERARVAAESGVQWMAYRFRVMNRPMPKAGAITSDLAYGDLWQGYTESNGTAVASLRDCILTDLKKATTAALGGDGHSMHTTSDIYYLGGKSPTEPRFSIEINQDSNEGRVLYLTVTGKSGGAAGSPDDGAAVRKLQVQFWIGKHILYGVAGRVPIQIGKNVLVDGNIAMTSKFYGSMKSNQPGVLCLSDFRYVPNQDLAFSTFENLVKTLRSDSKISPTDLSNRISTGNAAAMDAATKAGYSDANGDGYIDEYDLFLKRLGAQSSDYGMQISKTLYNKNSDFAQDPALFSVIDQLHFPQIGTYNASTDTWVSPKDPNDPLQIFRPGFLDGNIDDRDGYAKIYGTVTVIDDDAIDQTWLQGPIVSPDSTQAAVSTSLTAEQKQLFPQLMPDSFADCSAYLRNLTGDKAGSSAQTSSGSVKNKILTLDDLAKASDNSSRTPGDYELAYVVDPGKTGLTKGSLVPYSTIATANAKLSASNQATSSVDAGMSYVYDAGSTSLTKGTFVPQATIDAANKALKGSQKAAVAIPGANWAVEQTPWGSSSPQAIYKRPVFRNVHFQNVVIPKGMNALFQNCTFDGVTFSETVADTGVTTYPDDPGQTANNAWAWIDSRTDASGKANRSTQVMLPSNSVTGGVVPKANSNEVRTNGSEQGNNLRFDSCTFNGPVAGNNADVYTHCANSWEFTGNSVLNNTWIDPTTQSESVAICSPQVNIEMGSYQAGKVNRISMKGVIVAGNFDVRGQGIIDGQIIVTGDGAGNTTLGYFGSSDGATTVSAADVSKSPWLIIRYNSKRALPYGVAVPIDILPIATSYLEYAK